MSTAAAAKKKKKETAHKDDVQIQTPHTLRLLKLIQQGTFDHAQQATHILIHQVAPSLSPTQVWDLIGRLSECCMFHNEWRARVNASLGVQGLATWVDDLNSSSDSSLLLLLVDEKKELGMTVQTVLECLGQILEHGRPLYAKSGDACYEDDTELLYDLDTTRLKQQQTDDDDGDDSFAKQRMYLQQDILKRRLGLAGIGQAGIDTAFLADMVSSDDLVASTQNDPPRKRQRTTTTTTTDASDPTLRVLLVLEMEGELRCGQSTNSTGVAFGSRRPQALLAAEAIYRILDPDWEIRHGATLACLGLVKAWFSKDRPTARLGLWPEQVLARCLCLLALDRFCDFSSGEDVVLPVQEATGQLISVLFAMVPETIRGYTMQALCRLAKRGEWEVRHGAMIAFKFIIALFTSNESRNAAAGPERRSLDIVEPARVASSSKHMSSKDNADLLNQMAQSAVYGLSDTSDDVRSVAANILIEFIELPPSIPNIARECVLPVWNWLSQREDLDCSCTSHLALLFSLLIERAYDLLAKQLQPQEQSDGAAGPHDSMSALHRIVAVTDRLLKHPLPSLKLPGVRCVRALAAMLTNELVVKSDSPNNVLNSSMEAYTVLLVSLFETFFDAPYGSIGDEEPRRSFVVVREEAWQLLLTVRCNSSLIQGQSILEDVEVVLITRYFGINLRRSRTDDLFDRYLLASEALGSFAAAGCGRQSTLTIYFELALSAFLQSPYPCQCEAACLLAVSIVSKQPMFVLPKNITALLDAALALSAPQCLRLALCADQTNYTRLDELDLVKTCDDAFNQGVSLVSKAGCKTDSNVVDCITEIWFKAFKSRFGFKVAQTDIAPSVMSMRLNATIAGAIVAIGLPEKLTPIIRSLMTSVKNENLNEQEVSRTDARKGMHCLTYRQTYACRHLAQLLIRTLCHNEHAGARQKTLDSLCFLATDDQLMASMVIELFVGESTRERRLSEMPVIWNRVIVLCENHLKTATDESTMAVCLLNIVCRGLSHSQGCRKGTTSDLICFVSPLIRIACSCQDEELVASCISSLEVLCTIDLTPILRETFTALLPFLKNQLDNLQRRSACGVLGTLVSKVGSGICPFVRALLPVVLSLMTDPEPECSGTASKVFAALVRVAPLVQQEESISIEEMSPNSIEETVIDHLILGKAMPPVILPEVIQILLSSSGTKLRDYQKEGIAWLKFLQCVNVNGALCDSMGLGKSLQALVGMALSHVEPSSGSIDPDAISLIVCPSSVVGHFIQEIDKFFPKRQLFRPLCFVGSSAARSKMWRSMSSETNVVVTSYSVLRSDIELLSTKHWRYCVLDEGHLLKNPKTATARASRKIRARHRLILTGTPIQNRVHELWATFDFLMPNFLGSESAFSAEFAKPITKGQLPGATAIAINESMEKLKILHQQCLPFILRREKEQVLKELPPKITSDIKVPMTALQSKVYQSFLNRPVGQAAHEKLQSIVDTDRSEHEVLSLSRDVLKSILFMRLVCTHPALVTCQREDNETERIGFEASGKLLALVEILRSAGIYDEDSITGADNDTSLLYCEDDSKNGNAFESFVQSVDATMTASSDFGSRLYDKKSKCIIFAQFSKSLDVVENMVLKRLMPSVQYVRLDGSVPAEKRADVATTFNCNSNVRLILATTRVGGLGLNLTGADTVIFLENDFNPYVDRQSADRAHRIGQTKSVSVYNLITCDSIEENIMMIQAKKIAMSEAIINTDNSTLYSMGTDRLLDIFSARNEGASESSDIVDLDTLAERLNQEYATLSVDEFLGSLNA